MPKYKRTSNRMTPMAFTGNTPGIAFRQPPETQIDAQRTPNQPLETQIASQKTPSGQGAASYSPPLLFPTQSHQRNRAIPHPCLRSRDTVKVIRVRKIGIGVGTRGSNGSNPIRSYSGLRLIALASHTCWMVFRAVTGTGIPVTSWILSAIRLAKASSLHSSPRSSLVTWIYRHFSSSIACRACIFQPLTGVMPSVELNADLVFRVSEVKIYGPVQTLHSNLVIDAGASIPYLRGTSRVRVSIDESVPS